MAKAVKHGKLRMADVPPGARDAVASMAKMSDDQLEDYQHLERPKRKSLLVKG